MKKGTYIISLIAGLLLLANMKTTSQTLNYPPSCVVTMPHSNAYLKAGTDVVIQVYATDFGKSSNNGTVSNVEFFVDDVKIGEETSHNDYTYTFTWGCATEGEYRITARATNNNGVSFTSVGVLVTVGTQDVPQHGMSACKGKYLANIIPNSAQLNYNQLWNGVTAENSCKWESVEGTRDNMNWSGADVSYNHAKNNHMMFRYHAAVWASQYPKSWLPNLSTADARAEAVEYMEAIAERYPYIDQIDVLNEQLGRHQADNQLFRDLFSGIQNCPEDNFSWQIWLFTEARRIFPNTKLVLNDYGLENDRNAINMQLNLLKALRDRGIVDGFGTQAHCFNIDNLTGAFLQESLDIMEDAGLPIYVTELDLNGNVESDNNETQQLQSYQTHFPVFWEHPAVAGITLWGYINGSTWKNGTGILSSSGTPKQALTWMQQYINGQTDVGYPFCQTTGCTPDDAPRVSFIKPEIGKGFAVDVQIDIEVEVTDEDNNVTLVEFYVDDVKIGEDATAPYTATWTSDSEGSFDILAIATDADDNKGQSKRTVAIKAPQVPYGGTPHAIPGKIEFEEFDTGGQDSAYYDVDAGTNVNPAPDFRKDEDVDIEFCEDTDEGYNIGWTAAGEWLEYTVDVEKPGTYNIILRAACDGTGRTISLSTNDTPIATDITIPDTQGWQIWEDVIVEDVPLQAGVQILRVTIGATNYVNLNYMTFEPSVVSDPPTINIIEPTDGSQISSSETVAITASASSNSGTISKVDFYINDELVGTDNSSPYTHSWSGMSIGSYEITATATDDSNISASSTITVTVTEAPVVITLKAGWNLIGCPLSGSTLLEEALSSIWSNVLIIKDMDGFYIRDQDDFLNSLDSVKWGHGYYINVSEDCDLNWND